MGNVEGTRVIWKENRNPYIVKSRELFSCEQKLNAMPSNTKKTR